MRASRGVADDDDLFTPPGVAAAGHAAKEARKNRFVAAHFLAQDPTNLQPLCAEAFTTPPAALATPRPTALRTLPVNRVRTSPRSGPDWRGNPPPKAMDPEPTIKRADVTDLRELIERRRAESGLREPTEAKRPERTSDEAPPTPGYGHMSAQLRRDLGLDAEQRADAGPDLEAAGQPDAPEEAEPDEPTRRPPDAPALSPSHEPAQPTPLSLPAPAAAPVAPPMPLHPYRPTEVRPVEPSTLLTSPPRKELPPWPVRRRDGAAPRDAPAPPAAPPARERRPRCGGWAASAVACALVVAAVAVVCALGSPPAEPAPALVSVIPECAVARPVIERARADVPAVRRRAPPPVSPPPPPPPPPSPPVATSAACRWDWAKKRCTPTDRCVLRPAWRPRNMCRLRRHA